jgi:hypothetical protein
MKRLLFSTPLFSALLAVMIVASTMLLSSCQPPTVGYQAQGFATIRVMNFAGFCTSPLDIYWDPAGQTPEAQAKLYGLNFGAAGVYATGIVTGPAGMTYHLFAKRTRDTTPTTLIHRDVNFQPGVKYTWIISSPKSTEFVDTLIEDATATQGDPKKEAFIRFANEMPNSPNLALYVNDPTPGVGVRLSDTTGDGYRGVDRYFALPAAADVGYAYFVINAKTNGIVARLVNQTPVAGQYYTLVYSGDLCRTPLQNPGDTTTDRADTIRLRTFDDNGAGNDLTLPVPISMRYNVINGVVDAPFKYGDIVNDSRDNQLGFVFNTFTLPRKHNFSMDPVLPFHAGGLLVTAAAATQQGDDSVYNVFYQNADLPNPLDIRTYATDGISDSTTHQLFDNPQGATLNSKVKLTSDNSYTFMWADTASVPGKTNKAFNGTIIPIPDVSYANAIRLVLIPGIIAVKGPKSGVFYSSFFYTDSAGTTLPSASLNKKSLLTGKNSGSAFGQFDTSIVIRTTIPRPITISTKIGEAIPPSLTGPTETFIAEPGGIYEVALLGKRENPHLLIMRVNPAGH